MGEYGKVTIRGFSFDIHIDEDGNFWTVYEHQTVRRNTLKELNKVLSSKVGTVNLNIPVVIRDSDWTGRRRGTGATKAVITRIVEGRYYGGIKVRVKYEDGRTDQITLDSGVLRGGKGGVNMAKLNKLQKAKDAAEDAYRRYLESVAISKEEVEQRAAELGEGTIEHSNLGEES